MLLNLIAKSNRFRIYRKKLKAHAAQTAACFCWLLLNPFVKFSTLNHKRTKFHWYTSSSNSLHKELNFLDELRLVWCSWCSVLILRILEGYYFTELLKSILFRFKIVWMLTITIKDFRISEDTRSCCCWCNDLHSFRKLVICNIQHLYSIC